MKIGRQHAVKRAQDLLSDAVTELQAWEPALEAVADACSARSGQLICTGPDGEITLNLLTGTTAGAVDAAVACGLGDPVANPRLRAGLDAPPMVPVADQDYADADVRRQASIYGEFFDPYDLRFNCQAVLLRRDDLLVRMSVTRTLREGPLDDEAFAAFRELMPTARAAVRLWSAIDAARTIGMVQSLDAAGVAAMLLDERGRLVDATRAGMALLREGSYLVIRNDRPEPTSANAAAFDAALCQAMAAMRSALPVAPDPIMLRSADGMSCAMVTLQPLPYDSNIPGISPAILVVVRPGIDDAGRAAILRHDFRLTDAEAEVALLLAAGERPSAIARRRNVALPTVRSQIKAVYAKLDIRRQAELAARVQSITTCG